MKQLTPTIVQPVKPATCARMQKWLKHLYKAIEKKDRVKISELLTEEATSNWPWTSLELPEGMFSDYQDFKDRATMVMGWVGDFY